MTIRNYHCNNTIADIRNVIVLMSITLNLIYNDFINIDFVYYIDLNWDSVASQNVCGLFG